MCLSGLYFTISPPNLELRKRLTPYNNSETSGLDEADKHTDKSLSSPHCSTVNKHPTQYNMSNSLTSLAIFTEFSERAGKSNAGGGIKKKNLLR